MVICSFGSACGRFPMQGLSLYRNPDNFVCFSVLGLPNRGIHITLKAKSCFCVCAKDIMVDCVKCSKKQDGDLDGRSRKMIKVRRTDHHLWKKKDSGGSGQKAAHLVGLLSGLPNEKEIVYGALNKWVAWEVEFPMIAAAKALRILRNRSQWLRVIQVAKWMLSKGQGATMATYDTLLLAFDMDRRVDEAESLWNMILHTHTRSIPKRLFSRIIALYAHHDLQDKVIEVFADMEELGVRPDEDTTRKVAHAFKELGQEEKRKLVLKRYLSEFKYVHFNGERVRVKRYFFE